MPSAGIHHLPYSQVSAPALFLGAPHMTSLKLPRRQFLHLAAGAAALSAVPRIARAQAYPLRPVRWIVPYPPGGSTDIVARIMSPWISERLGQQVIVENRPGGGTNIGVQAVVNSQPDGYTLLFVGAVSAVNVALYPNLPFNFLLDIVPVSGLVELPNVLVVHPSFPARSVPEFITYAKANPGKLNVASPGSGTGPHVAGELFKVMTNLNWTHVPYRGEAPALTDLLGRQVQAMFVTLTGAISHIRSGALRALAVTTKSRSAQLPELSCANDFVPGYEAGIWFGVGAPKGTSAAIIDRLNREINAGLADPKIRAQLAELGAAPMVQTPSEFGAHVAAETEKWGKVVRAANIKPE
jgi:tripartite-type tricarboxylate transporter receptor subunit TctC